MNTVLFEATIVCLLEVWLAVSVLFVVAVFAKHSRYRLGVFLDIWVFIGAIFAPWTHFINHQGWFEKLGFSNHHAWGIGLGVLLAIFIFFVRNRIELD